MVIGGFAVNVVAKRLVPGIVFGGELSEGTLLPKGSAYPQDYFLGLPLAVITDDIEAVANDPNAECHHLYFPRRRAQLAGGAHGVPEQVSPRLIPGMALRVSLGLRIGAEVHDYLHDWFPYGPNLPGDQSRKWSLILAATMGLRSRWAVDIRNREAPHLVTLDDNRFDAVNSLVGTEYFWDAKRADYGRRVMGRYLLGLAVNQSLGGVQPSEVEAFVAETDLAAKAQRAFNILKYGLDEMVKTLKPVRVRCANEGMVRTGAKAPVDEMIATINPLAAAQFINVLEEKFRVSKTDTREFMAEVAS